VGAEQTPEALTMAYYCTCPYCDANLDPGEICRCRTKKKEAAQVQAGTASDQNDHGPIVPPGPPPVKRETMLDRMLRDLEDMGVKIPEGIF
jgi:hypothetical protein